MGGNIPKPIKVNVLKKWLQGKSRDQIAKEEGIGTGTVSSIIKECRKNDTEFDLLRQVAVDLKNHSESAESFAALVRIRETLRRELLLLQDKTIIGIKIAGGQEHHDGDLKRTLQLRRQEPELEEILESILQALLVFCFKHNLPIRDFVDLVYELCRVANSLDVSLENLPGYVEELKNNVQSLNEEIEAKKLEKKEALEDYDVTLEDLEEYKASWPLFKENQKLREELDKVRKERDYYKRRVEGDVANDLADDYNKDWVPENPHLKDFGEGQEEE